MSLARGAPAGLRLFLLALIVVIWAPLATERTAPDAADQPAGAPGSPERLITSFEQSNPFDGGVVERIALQIGRAHV